MSSYAYDGTCRGVVFEDAAAAILALLPGRAELDCVAVGNGFMPEGASLVSRAVVAPDIIQGEEEGALEAVQRIVRRSEYITPGRDGRARRCNVVDSKRYDAMVRSIGHSR